MRAHAKRSPSQPTLLGRLHRCQDGQAIFVMILYFFLLAGLLFLVLNSGSQLNDKVTVQAAADSTAFTGAAWFCREMNAISMANTVDTQLLSMIVLLDTLESVVPPATQCIEDLTQNIGAAAAHRDIPVDPRTCDWLAVGNAAGESQIIHMFYNVVQGIPISDYCSYDSGVLWECIKLMDGFGHAVLKVAPRVTQRESIDVATRNHAEFGFVVPLWPVLPAIDTQFADFHDPMAFARLPAPQAGKVIGGFSALWGYATYNGHTVGPWGYWRDPFTGTTPMGLFDLSRFSVMFNVVSFKKLEMLFGSTDDKVSLNNWEMDYDKAKGMDPTLLRRVWWETTGFDSRYPFPEDSFFASMNLRWQQKPPMHTQCYADLQNRFTQDPAMNRLFSIRWHLPGWPDLTTVGAKGAHWVRSKEAWEGADPRLAVWYRVTEQKSANYPQLGIFAPHPPLHQDGSKWPYTEAEMQTYYHTEVWRFNGAELEADTPLHRRYMAAAGSTPPFAPIMLAQQAWVTNKANMMKWYTFNGFAYRPGAVKEWTERFINPNPIEKTIGYAEAHVYNRISYDLFTQYWQAKLTRTDRWKEMIPLIEQGVPSDGSDISSVLTQDKMKPVVDMLNAYDWEFVREVTH